MVNPRQGKGFLPAGSIFTIRRSRWAFSPPIQLDDQPTPIGVPIRRQSREGIG